MTVLPKNVGSDVEALVGRVIKSNCEYVGADDGPVTVVGDPSR